MWNVERGKIIGLVASEVVSRIQNRDLMAIRTHDVIVFTGGKTSAETLHTIDQSIR